MLQCFCGRTARILCFDGFCLCEQRVNTKTGQVSDAAVAMMDVYQEFNELSEKFKIMKFKSKVGVVLDTGRCGRMNVIPL